MLGPSTKNTHGHEQQCFVCIKLLKDTSSSGLNTSQLQPAGFDSKMKSCIPGIEIHFFYSVIFQPVHYQEALISKAYLVLLGNE